VDGKTAGAITRNIWQHVALVGNATTVAMILNGVVGATAGITPPYYPSSFYTTLKVRLHPPAPQLTRPLTDLLTHPPNN